MKSLESVVLADLLDPATLGGALAYLLAFVVLGWLGHRALRFGAQQLFQREHRYHVDKTLISYASRLLGIGLDVVLLTLYAHLVPALHHLGTALLAGVSVVSLVVGLAAQNTLGNLVAGVTLALYRPFELGDRLQIGAPTGLEAGVVEDLSLGYTTLRTFDNRRIVVPNGVMAAQVIVNLSSVDPRVMAAVAFGIGYDADVELARRTLVQLASSHPRVEKVEGCPVTKLGESAVMLSLRAWCPDADAARQFEFDMYELAKRRFAELGIDIPFPTRTVVLQRRDPGEPGAIPPER